MAGRCLDLSSCTTRVEQLILGHMSPTLEAVCMVQCTVINYNGYSWTRQVLEFRPR